MNPISSAVGRLASGQIRSSVAASISSETV